MNIEYLKKSVKLALKEKFIGIKYGDDYRQPLHYIATYTTSARFNGRLPKNISMQSTNSYHNFPKLSKELLVELFSYIGVKYVPEICLHQLQKRRPIEIFVDFVMSFGITMEHRLEEIEIVDSDILNRVIMNLKNMDEIRREKMSDSRPIYRLLAQHEFDKAEKIIEDMR